MAATKPSVSLPESSPIVNSEVPSISYSMKRKRPPKIEIPSVLREIQTDARNFNSRDSTTQNDAICFNTIGAGVSSIKGKKSFMEDTHKIISSFHGNSATGFFGVYDGHGGRKAAEFVAENLHNNILEIVENSAENLTKEEAVKAAYLKTDQEFLKQGLSSGACCVTALIKDEEIVVSNLGDCRAVLCRNGVAEALTRDQRAGREDERIRIEAQGGYVENHRGRLRVHGVLSVSRSIGDSHLKDWVLAEPESRTLCLESGMEFLILASDGLWDMVCNQEAVDTVMRSVCLGKKLGSTGDLLKETEDELGCVSTSPSSKIKRIAILKPPQKIINNRSPSPKRTVDISKESEEHDFGCESYYSPPLKVRRTSGVKQRNTRKRPPAYGGLADACTELVKLAVSRGALDDITVMIIDLNHFRCRA